MDFPDFVKNFTAGITRMHIGDYIYKEEDFTPFPWQFYKDDLLDIENTYTFRRFTQNNTNILP